MKKSEKNHEVSKDESHKGIDDIQKTTDKFVAEVDKISHAKEKDVMDV
jgi:ribosome recycling factor